MDGVCYLTEKKCQIFQKKQYGVEGQMRRGSIFLVAWLYLFNHSDSKPFHSLSNPQSSPQRTSPWSAGGFDLLSSGLDTVQNLKWMRGSVLQDDGSAYVFSAMPW